jgi:polysaccharide export outer membrane protein
MKITMTKMAFTCSLLLAAVTIQPARAAAQNPAPQNSTAASNLINNDVPTAAVPVSGAPASQSRIQIGPGDLLNVSVFDVPEMAQTVRVSDTGNATFNLIGSVHLAGLTTDDARVFLARKLKEGNYILDPQVSVLISEYSTQGVSVLGEVNKPGVYPVLGQRSLLDIISEAGGTTPTAGPEITVKHLDGTTATVRLTKNAKTAFSTDVELLPGDKVVIPRAGIIYVLGEVGRPGGFVMENDGNISVLQAVSMAGGINRTASMNRSRLIRKSPNGYTETSIPLQKLLQGDGGDMQLQAEDILYVPTNALKSAVYRTAPAVVSAASSAAIYRAIP